MQTSNKELILLVDDDPGNLKRAQTILGEEFRISATTSGKMALSLLSKVTPDLILLDVNMPEMNGFETLKKIRELENGSMIPVVFLTGDNDAETETKCFEAGAMDFVGKPFVSQVLVSRVKRILENRQPLHIDVLVISKSIGIFSFILTVNSGIPYCPPVFTDISHHKIITSSYLPHSIIIFSHLSYPSCELFRHNV